MNPAKLFLASLLALFLSSCAIWSNPGAVRKIPDSALNSKDTGIIIMSSGAHEACILTTTFVHLFERTANEAIKSLNINHTSMRSEFETHHGGVSGFALEYDIHQKRETLITCSSTGKTAPGKYWAVNQILQCP